MKKVSARLTRLYLSAMLRASAQLGSRNLSPSTPAMVRLRARKDYLRVMSYLAACGYIRLSYADDDILNIHLCDSALTYFETDRDARRERRWTRGLAIAALIISIASLCIAGLSLYLQYRSLSPQ